MNKKRRKSGPNIAALMIDRLSSYKWIKFCQSLILIVMGVLFMALSSVEGFINFVTMAFFITLLIYSVLEIFSAIMLKRSILSTEIFVSLMIFAISLTVICNQNLANDNNILVWFFGVLIVGYTLILITSGVLALTVDSDDAKYGTSKSKRIALAVIQFVIAGILVALDISLWIFGLRQTDVGETSIYLIPFLIGIALILMGCASMFYGFQAIKTEKILKKQEEAKAEALSRIEEENPIPPSPVPTGEESPSEESSIVTVDAFEQGRAEKEEDPVAQIEDAESKRDKKRRRQEK